MATTGIMGTAAASTKTGNARLMLLPIVVAFRRKAGYLTVGSRAAANWPACTPAVDYRGIVRQGIPFRSTLKIDIHV